MVRAYYTIGISQEEEEEEKKNEKKGRVRMSKNWKLETGRV
jgi:hypothetical protein